MGSGSREADVWVGYGEEFRRLFCERGEEEERGAEERDFPATSDST